MTKSQSSSQSIKTLRYDLGEEKWVDGGQDDLKMYDLPDICFVFMSWEKFTELNKSGASLLRAFGAPRFLGQTAMNELNGYFGSRTQHRFSEDGREISDDLDQCSTWFQVLAKMVRKAPNDETRPNDPEYATDTEKDYQWYEMGFFTFWKKTTGDGGVDKIVLRVLCVDTPQDTPESLKQLLEARQQSEGTMNVHDPLVLHGVLLEKIILLLDIAVWRVRDRVRDIEKTREHTSVGKRFVNMHEIGRHGIHMSEVLGVCASTISSFMKYQDTVYERMKNRLGTEYTMQVHEYTRFQLGAIKSLNSRSLSNDKRLENEITLAFNSIAQSDNTVVMSIAVLTMFFLPATFVSSIFSTSFFDFQESGWNVSDQFWIFWAVAIPATLMAPLYVAIAFRKPKKLWKAWDGWNGRKAAASATPASTTQASSTPASSTPTPIHLETLASVRSVEAK